MDKHEDVSHGDDVIERVGAVMKEIGHLLRSCDDRTAGRLVVSALSNDCLGVGELRLFVKDGKIDGEVSPLMCRAFHGLIDNALRTERVVDTAAVPSNIAIVGVIMRDHGAYLMKFAKAMAQLYDADSIEWHTIWDHLHAASWTHNERALLNPRLRLALGRDVDNVSMSRAALNAIYGLQS